MRTKVFFVYNSFKFAYARRSFLLAFKNKGHLLTIIAPEDAYRQKLEAHGFRCLKLKKSNKSRILAAAQYFTSFFVLFKRERPRLVCLFTVQPNIFGSLACMALGIPVVNNLSGLGSIYLKGGLWEKLLLTIYRLVFAKSQRVFCQNPDDLKLLAHEGVAPLAIIELLPGSGINCEDYQLRNLPEPKNGKIIFLLLARIIRDKGILNYFEAAKLIKKRFPNIKFLLGGSIDANNPSSLQWQDLQRLISEGNVDYLGEVQNKKEVIDSCHCAVLPSFREGTPRFLLEAMAMGRPILTSNVPGCNYLVENDTNGFLFEANNTASLVNSLTRFCELDYQVVEEMGLNSRRIIENNFDEKLVVGAYHRQIERISSAK